MPAASCSQATTSYTSCLPPASPRGGSRRTPPRQNKNSWHSMDYLHIFPQRLEFVCSKKVCKHTCTNHTVLVFVFVRMRLWKKIRGCAWLCSDCSLQLAQLHYWTALTDVTTSAGRAFCASGYLYLNIRWQALLSVLIWLPWSSLCLWSGCACSANVFLILHSCRYSGSSRRPVVGWDSWVPKVDQQDDATLVRGVLNRMLKRIVKDQTFPLLPCPRCLITCYDVATFWYDQTQMASETNIGWTAVCPQLSMRLQQREQSFTNAKAGTFCSFRPRSESVTRRRTSLPVGKAFLWVSQKNNLTPLSSRD